jgi:hypothetical protein
MDEKTSILLPEFYENDDEAVAGASCWDDPETGVLFKTCIAYDVIDKHHPRILKYLGRDPWTGYPLLETPTGPSLDDFIKTVHMDMYPPSKNNQTIKLSDDFLPLVINWALQLLSALRFIHNHDIRYGSVNKEVCVLSSSLSISFVGFSGVYFGESYGPQQATRNDPPTVQTDLQSWAKLYYSLVLGDNQGEYSWHFVFPDPNPEGIHPDAVGCQVLLKCRANEYTDATAVWDDFVAELNEKGFTVEEDSLKDFGPPEALGIHHFRNENGQVTMRGGLGGGPRPPTQSRRATKAQLWKCQLGIDEYVALYHDPNANS